MCLELTTRHIYEGYKLHWSMHLHLKLKWLFSQLIAL
jgi:hypothetical protein